ncbi:MAG: hypothetical protein IPG06_07870 [Haliea sp.]|nr:hypothetical protein [Haliea sp.]
MTDKKVVKFTLEARNRYVEDWELEEWCKVASPFLLAYASLKGVTGLRKQDMLTIKRSDISATELTSVNIKTGKKIRFPLYDQNGQATTVKLAIDDVQDYYRSIRNPRVPVISQFLFHNRKVVATGTLRKPPALASIPYGSATWTKLLLGRTSRSDSPITI